MRRSSVTDIVVMCEFVKKMCILLEGQNKNSFQKPILVEYPKDIFL